MRFIGTISILALICATPTQAGELLSRKLGLWEVKTSVEGRDAPPRVIKQCIDAVVDQMMQSTAGPYNAVVCPKRDVQKSANSVTIDSTCTVGGKAATAHTVITGSLDSAYTMTVTSQTEDSPASKTVINTDAKWLGPCTADQKPGDMVLDNGVKINILETRQHAPATGNPQPPG
jgi:hypothetical protein